jgi:hypothetical protein
VQSKKSFWEKYNRSAMENTRQLQCKALRELEKSRRRNNNGEQWKKQCAEQWKQSEIRARADDTHKNNRPPPRGAGRTHPRLGFQP